MSLQTKALQTAKDFLDKYDQVPAYTFLSRTLVNLKVSADDQRIILDQYQKELTKMNEPISQAKNWVYEVIEDLKNNK